MKFMYYNQRMNLEQELYHYGIPGMKWGHRKAVMSNPSVRAARAKYKKANKAFNKAHRRANGISDYLLPQKQRKAIKKEKWDDAYNKAKAANKAKKEYKSAVKSAKQKAKKEYASSKEKKKQYKEAYKHAKKEYNKSFNKAYNRSIGAYSPIKKHRQNAEKRWEDVASKAKAMDEAKKNYKSLRR